MPTKEEVVDELKNVVDPHTGTDVYDMGLISNLDLIADSVSLTFTPTSPFCPTGVQLAVQIKKNPSQIEGLEADDVNITVEGHMQSDQINEKLASGEL